VQPLGSKHGTVSPVRPRARDLPTQDRDLMPQHEDLRILRGVTQRQEHQPAEHPGYDQLDETDNHEDRSKRAHRHGVDRLCMMQT